MRIGDWSSDVCSSDLTTHLDAVGAIALRQRGDVSLWSRRCRGQASRRTATVAQPRACAGIVEREHGRSVEVRHRPASPPDTQERKSVEKGKRVSESVDIGERRIIKKKNTEEIY